MTVSLRAEVTSEPVVDAIPVLDAGGVSKRFGRQLVLDQFAFDVRAGEVHALVGHNGSGKSTFVKILSGFHQPEPGATAQVDGQQFDVGDAHAAHAVGLRFVHQDLGLVETLNAVDNILLGRRYPSRRLRRIDWPAARRGARGLLASLGYDVSLRAPVGTFPLIERTGIAIARALYIGDSVPRVLVLDEPTAALPAPSVSRLFDVVRRLTARGLAVLYISHHLEEVFQLANRVTVLRDGRLMATRNVEELTESELVELMVGATIAHDRSARTTISSAAPVLRVSGLESAALRGVDLEVGAGEVVGVAGVAGSGRDEFAGALFGLYPRRGEVSVEARRLPAERPDLAISAGLGLLPAERLQTGLVAHLSVAENLTLTRLPSSLGGLYLDHREESRDVRSWLNRLDVRPRDPALPVQMLSGGNQQKVLLGRWLRAEPRVLLLDEPTQGVDVGAVAQIRSLIRDQAAKGTAFVICSSDTDELVALCDRVVVLSRGRSIGQASGPSLRRDVIDELCLAVEQTTEVENDDEF